MRFLLLLLSLALPAWATADDARSSRRIAFSFDDAPLADGALLSGVERTDRLIAALAEAGVKQAAFFVTTNKLDRLTAAERLRAYVAAGHVLANHSHSHPGLSRSKVPDYLADIERAQAQLAAFDGVRPWFRFPFLDEGRDEARRDQLRQALAEAGLQNGYVTVDNYDWYLAARVERAARAGLRIDHEALRRLYVDMLIACVEFYDAIARQTLERSPAHVLLLHENDIAALFVADLVAALRERGWQIIGVDEAYADPIATLQPATLFNNQGRVAAIAEAAGRPRPELLHASEDEVWIDAELSRRAVFSELSGSQ
jgi:peptidoglycan/xylan/chitin deacetylase (PgdA/CDA1 family)